MFYHYHPACRQSQLMTLMQGCQRENLGWYKSFWPWLELLFVRRSWAEQWMLCWFFSNATTIYFPIEVSGTSLQGWKQSTTRWITYLSTSQWHCWMGVVGQHLGHQQTSYTHSPLENLQQRSKTYSLTDKQRDTFTNNYPQAIALYTG